MSHCVWKWMKIISILWPSSRTFPRIPLAREKLTKLNRKKILSGLRSDPPVWLISRPRYRKVSPQAFTRYQQEVTEKVLFFLLEIHKYQNLSLSVAPQNGSQFATFGRISFGAMIFGDRRGNHAAMKNVLQLLTPADASKHMWKWVFQFYCCTAEANISTKLVWHGWGLHRRIVCGKKHPTWYIWEMRAEMFWMPNFATIVMVICENAIKLNSAQHVRQGLRCCNISLCAISIQW